jgi:hypothetical protein
VQPHEARNKYRRSLRFDVVGIDPISHTSLLTNMRKAFICRKERRKTKKEDRRVAILAVSPKMEDGRAATKDSKKACCLVPGCTTYGRDRVYYSRDDIHEVYLHKTIVQYSSLCEPEPHALP